MECGHHHFYAVLRRLFTPVVGSLIHEGALLKLLRRRSPQQAVQEFSKASSHFGVGINVYLHRVRLAVIGQRQRIARLKRAVVGHGHIRFMGCTCMKGNITRRREGLRDFDRVGRIKIPVFYYPTLLW